MEEEHEGSIAKSEGGRKGRGEREGWPSDLDQRNREQGKAGGRKEVGRRYREGRYVQFGL